MALNDALPSLAGDVFEYNAQQVDNFVTSASLTYTDRLGTTRFTIAGAIDQALDGVGAKIFDDTVDGLAGTVDGQFFWIVGTTGDFALELYKNVSASAVDQGKKLLDGDANVILW